MIAFASAKATAVLTTPPLCLKARKEFLAFSSTILPNNNGLPRGTVESFFLKKCLFYVPTYFSLNVCSVLSFSFRNLSLNFFTVDAGPGTAVSFTIL